MAKRKTRYIHYKRAVFSDPAQSLQKVLSAALKGKAKTADKRRENFTESSGTFRLINRFQTYSGTLFGQFIVYESDRRQPLVKIESGKTYYPLATSNPGENEAFADEIFYFGARDNDLVCAQTRSIRTRELETHLAWLLTTLTGLVDEEVTLILSDQPDNKVYKRLRKNPVKAVKIGTEVFAHKEAQSHGRREKRRFSLSGLGGDILKQLLSQADYEKLRFEDDLDEANLRVMIELSFLRKTTAEGQRALDSLATSFRHIEGADYEVKLRRGGTIKGNDIKVSSRATVRFLETGLVDENDLYKQMHEWLIETLVAQTE